MLTSYWLFDCQSHAGAEGGDSVGRGLGGSWIPWLVLMVGGCSVCSETVLLCIAGPENQD